MEFKVVCARTAALHLGIFAACCIITLIIIWPFLLLFAVLALFCLGLIITMVR